jgi:transposase InsO family protein
MGVGFCPRAISASINGIATLVLRYMPLPQELQSMSRKGNCWVGLPVGYKSPTERFFRSLKHEQPNYQKFRTKASAKLGIIDYLAFYNGKRYHSKLGYQSSLQFERDYYR